MKNKEFSEKVKTEYRQHLTRKNIQFLIVLASLATVVIGLMFIIEAIDKLDVVGQSISVAKGTENEFYDLIYSSVAFFIASVFGLTIIHPASVSYGKSKSKESLKVIESNWSGTMDLETFEIFSKNELEHIKAFSSIDPYVF